MVIEYFKAREYDFSLSVFLPESGITHEHQILDDSDIFQFLHLDHPSSSLQHLVRTFFTRLPFNAASVSKVLSNNFSSAKHWNPIPPSSSSNSSEAFPPSATSQQPPKNRRRP